MSEKPAWFKYIGIGMVILSGLTMAIWKVDIKSAICEAPAAIE